MKNFGKKLAATMAATALVFGGMVAGGATSASASVRNGIGSGAVDILSYPVSSYCVANGYPSGGCRTVGAGVVVPNQWGNNEVITAYHVIEGVPNDGQHMFVKIPGSSTRWHTYVQRVDQASDLAVLWLWGGDDGNAPWPTPAPQFQESNVVSSLPAYWANVVALGNAGGNSYLNNTYMDANYGNLLDNAYPQINMYSKWTHTWSHLYNTLETNAQTQPGDSGGPLVNLDAWQPGDQTAEVAGINDAKDTSGYSFAIEIGWAIWDMLHVRP